VALLKTGVLEEGITSIIKVERIRKLGTMLAVKNGIFWDVTPYGSCKKTFRRNLAPPSSG
jgi:hypothetical protein